MNKKPHKPHFEGGSIGVLFLIWVPIICGSEHWKGVLDGVQKTIKQKKGETGIGIKGRKCLYLYYNCTIALIILVTVNQLNPCLRLASVQQPKYSKQRQKGCFLVDNKFGVSPLSCRISNKYWLHKPRLFEMFCSTAVKHISAFTRKPFQATPYFSTIHSLVGFPLVYYS